MIPEESNVTISSDDSEMSEEDGYETVEEEQDGEESEKEETDDENDVEDDENDAEDDENDVEDEGKEKSGNAGWADAMNKILNVKKPLKKKTIVLAKAKRLTTMKIKEEAEEETEEKKPSLKILEKKREQIVKGRTKPNILEKDKEKALSRIATKGVVQLFNAVNIHKKGENEDDGESKKKKARVTDLSKKQFLTMLQGEKEIKTEDEDDDEEDDDADIKEESESNWDVLKDNFLTNTKLKNWDKASTAV